jgi:hypothetical protein
VRKEVRVESESDARLDAQTTLPADEDVARRAVCRDVGHRTGGSAATAGCAERFDAAKHRPPARSTWRSGSGRTRLAHVSVATDRRGVEQPQVASPTATWVLPSAALSAVRNDDRIAIRAEQSRHFTERSWIPVPCGPATADLEHPRRTWRHGNDGADVGSGSPAAAAVHHLPGGAATPATPQFDQHRVDALRDDECLESR